ncbi:retrovirus-related pol polyprotein from transposon opus, partial [Trifolium medium]|nr:retrovirus-related pol polyprotein from transposon opus [Trifolium medium]
SVSANINTLTSEFHDLRSRIPPPGFPPPFPPHGPDISPIPATTMKPDIPRFNGSDAMGWIFKINQFFDYHRTPEDQRLRIASFYMEGDALAWFQWMHGNGQLLNWSLFLQALESRFAPSLYEDPKGALFKLCQTASEEKFADRAPVKSFAPSPTAGSSTSSFKPTMTVAPPKSSTPIKRLTPDELQARRDKGLCYNCDERFQPGHRCKRQFHLLIVEPEDSISTEVVSALQTLEGDDPVEQDLPDPDPDPAQISLHALMGHTIPQTLRVMGQIHQSPIS